ncbi:MAG: polyprenyl synthetase family protein [Clostridia bacterium]|nr:polyprenyl synthetase family protein [Clostridia bacterium]
MNSLSPALTENAALTDRVLETELPSVAGPQKRLTDAMRYSLFPGGKRVRPFLTIEFCRLFGGRDDIAARFAAAVECVHTYSLIHDDLPCMDDDLIRRGRPSNHAVFGEAEALLAGDSLLTLAFGIIGRTECDGKTVAGAVDVLSRLAGSDGMAGGQSADLAFSSPTDVPYADFLAMNEMKTGCLIRAACILGTLAAGHGKGSREYEIADEFGRAVGLSFQIEDDLIDEGGDGLSFLDYMSREDAVRLIDELTEKAKSVLPPDAALLREFADGLTRRKL